MLKFLQARLAEPSSIMALGYTILQTIPTLIATPSDVTSWGMLLTGIGAFLKSEKAAS